MQNKLSIHQQVRLPSHNDIDRTIKINGIDFEEKFIAKLIAKHMEKSNGLENPTITTAYEIYSKESPAAHQMKFQIDTRRYFNYFLEIGSNHPIIHNNTYLLEKEFNWKGLMIEYDGSFEELYKTNRPNSIYKIIVLSIL